MNAALRCAAIRFLEIFRNKRLERELEEEMQFHLLMLGEVNQRRGMSREEAELEARRRFGSTELAKDQSRDEQGVRFCAAFAADARIALRMLAKDPRFTAGVSAVLCLTVAATIMIVSVVNAIVWRPLPYPDSAGIIQITKAGPGRLDDGHSHTSFQAIRDRTSAFSSLAAFESSGSPFYLEEIRDHVQAVAISSGYFSVLRVEPALGHGFLPAEEDSNAQSVVILSHDLWVKRFGSDPRVLGSVVSLNGLRHTVVGIMGQDFRSVPPADVWLPLRTVAGYKANTCTIIGRLKPGVSLKAAQSAVERVNAALDDLVHTFGGKRTIRLRPMHDVLANMVMPICLLLFIAIALVHAIACLNTANLVLAREFARARDTALRVALGASRGRILQLHLIESVMLAAASGIVGLLGAWAALPLLNKLAGGADWNAIAIDSDVLWFTFAFVVGSGLAFGLLPALMISRVDPNAALKEGRWKAVWSHGSLRRILVVGEVGFCVILLVGSGLLIRSLASMHKLDMGFDATRVATAQLSARSPGDRAPIPVNAYLRTLRRLQSAPHVEAAAIVSTVPAMRGVNFPVLLPDRWDRPGGTVQWRYITPDYFRAMRIRLWSGRSFDETDGMQAAAVAIVNRQFVQMFLPRESGLGSRLLLGAPLDEGRNRPRVGLATDPRLRDRVRTIVGIAGDVRERGLAHPPPPTVYVPITQVNEGLLQWANDMFPMSWVARMDTAGPVLLDSFRQDLATAGPELHFTGVSLMQTVISRSLSTYRLLTLAVSVFAGFALLISIYGIYGAISYTVVLRRKELAIGITLGASARRLLLSIASQGLVIGAAGVVTGLLGSLAGTKLLAAFVVGVSTSDPATLLGTALAVPFIAAIAALVPAIRAARIDPAAILRCD